MSNNGGRFKNGVIYASVEAIVGLLVKLNAVEGFKKISDFGQKRDEKRKIRYRKAIDAYVFFKWALVLVLWLLSIGRSWSTLLVIYLIGMNLFTYFYYHVWRAPFSESRRDVKRRFVNLFQAIFFNIFAYAYLYAIPFRGKFEWVGSNQTVDAFLFSINTSFVSDYQFVTSRDTFASIIPATQILVMFMFLTIILSNSVPSSEEEED